MSRLAHLLRACGARPHDRAAEQRNKFPPLQLNKFPPLHGLPPLAEDYPG
jgi:hypothetical protein